jgi:hypothetical protein
MPSRPVGRRHALVLALLAVVVFAGPASAGTSALQAATIRPSIVRTYQPPCSVFPATNVWNKRVDRLPVRSDSPALITFMGSSVGLHPDFGTFAGYGIPVNRVNSFVPRSPVEFEWPDESDAGPYPIPAVPLIEGNGADGDRHLLMIDKVACRLWELYAASDEPSGWTAGSGAIWNLGSNALRPNGWTSADAAGLPIYPGLARYSEVAAGVISHALRFTVPVTRQRMHLYPARHDAGSSTSASAPPMGLRLRLKASVDISSYGPQSRVILTALKQYGMILADNGSGYYVSGTSDSHWNDDELHGLGGIKGSMFEVVDTTGFVNG